jgi:anti-sigma factor RsiW
MSATTHPVSPEEIMAFLDGELSVERVQVLSEHIEQCAECREAEDALHDTLQSLGRWTVSPMPGQVEHEVLKGSIGLKKLAKDGFTPSLRGFLRRRRSLAWGGIALAALLIFFGLSSVRYDKASPESIRVARMRVAQQQASSLGKLEPGAAPAKPIADGQSKVFSNQIPLAGLDRLVTQATPGVATDSNGLFHGLGDHAQVSFSISPMIARSASLSIVVKDFDSGRASLDSILARHNGYPANLNVSTPQSARRTLQASLRIPAPQLAAALAELKALGRVEAEAQNGEEVTQQHADLVARIKNDLETEVRLQDILEKRTGKVKDVLEVEQEIARVRGEIEQMEAEQKSLEHRVDFATIDLRLTEEYKAQLSTPAPSVAMQLRNATINGFRNAFGSLLGLVLFFAESGPTLLLWVAILCLPAWLLWRRYQRAQSLGSSVSA